LVAAADEIADVAASAAAVGIEIAADAGAMIAATAGKHRHRTQTSQVNSKGVAFAVHFFIGYNPAFSNITSLSPYVY
jgi:hypothetical protein